MFLDRRVIMFLSYLMLIRVNRRLEINQHYFQRTRRRTFSDFNNTFCYDTK